MMNRWTQHAAILVVFSALLGVGAAPAAGQQTEDIVEKTSVFLEDLVRQNRFSGTVLIAKDGVPILEEAHGYASLAYQVPNRIDTKFNLGSMNKMFTGVAIAQLAEKGQLSFDDRIIDHIPDYPNQDIATRVKIHHLLTHTSGMGNYWTDEYERTSKDRFRAVEDYLPLFVDQPLRFEPGTDWSYSNSGFMVLGLIIEHVTGESYFDYVRRYIYEPAGMVNTDAYELDYVIPNLAVGYTRMGAREGELKNNLFLHVVKGGPAGGGYSTVEDLLTFSNALLDHQVLSREYTEKVMEGKANTDHRNRMYGYGFRTRTENGHQIVGHSGGFAGINAYLDMYLDLGYTVAVMSNFDRGAAEVHDFIMSLLVGKTQEMRDRELTDLILERISERGYDAGVTLYKESRGDAVVLENRVNGFGYRLLAENRISGAIDVFRFNVYLHPESANCYDSLGEAYMVGGNTELAIRNYEKSIELDPRNTNGAEMLKRLRETQR
jgi:CubicO group peptidase (beta-lactamase class C family)